ncbi:pitrilysin family protein [Persicobacter psychrovividus]|uniref:Insulinase family protein n=1 Tax=Persicobacter psychrovividus TaxID=387638 RepID=A0ABN6LI93_9BACT|nr:hypothetical protein PEPS_38830 [Persicobacter psychrovividus]
MKKLNFIYILLAFFFVSQQAFAQVDRTHAPKAEKPAKIKLKTPKTFTLPNGLKVLVVSNHEIPSVTFSLRLYNNPVLEGSKAGMSSITSSLMGSGTATRTKDEINEEMDFMGTAFSSGTSGMYVETLSRYKKKSFEIMADVALHSKFSKEEFEKAMNQESNGLAMVPNSMDAISKNLVNVANFGHEHPYGEIETLETLKNVTLADCQSFYENAYTPNNAYLSMIGDISYKEAKALATKYFSTWKKSANKTVAPTAPEAPSKTTIYFSDLESAQQSSITITNPIKYNPKNSDYIAAKLMANILGGGSSARLYKNLRETHGYTYGAYSYVSPNRFTGEFVASGKVRNAVTDSAIVEFMHELKAIRKAPVTQLELDQAKATMIGSYARSLEDPKNIASFAISQELYKLPKTFYATYIQKIQAVTLEDIQKAAEKYIQPENSNIIVVGKGSEVKESLKQFGEVVDFGPFGKKL